MTHKTWLQVFSSPLYHEYVPLPCHYEEDTEQISGPLGWKSIVRVLTTHETNTPQTLVQMVSLLKGSPVEVTFFDWFLSEHKKRGFSDFFGVILPKMKTLALRLEELFPKPDSLPVLLPQVDRVITLSQEQIACLMASAFFCLLPDMTKIHSLEFNNMDFSISFKIKDNEKMLCIMHYFERVCNQMPTGNVSFHRRVLTNIPNWTNSTKPIHNTKVNPSGNIENSESQVHVDFASHLIGGNIFHQGGTQEESLFSIKPELISAILFFPNVLDNEALVVHGAERFSDFSGWGVGFRYCGDFVDVVERDSMDHKNTKILAIDALQSWGLNQYHPENLTREITKAYIAFQGINENLPLPPVATGNWGCGSYGGDLGLKFFQQLLAASEAERDLDFFTFGEVYKGKDLDVWICEFNKFCVERKLCVGDVFRILVECGTKNDEENGVYDLVNPFEEVEFNFKKKSE